MASEPKQNDAKPFHAVAGCFGIGIFFLIIFVLIILFHPLGPALWFRWQADSASLEAAQDTAQLFLDAVRNEAMARQVANAASNAACFSTKLAAVWIMRTVKSDTESLGGHSRIPLQSALGRRGEPGKRSSQPGNSPTRDEKRLGNSGFQ
jgi:hypothetical protein